MLEKKDLFFIEGNMGAGKSTLIKLIKNYLNITLIEEPVDKWQNLSDINLLEYFYKDPKRWAYTFQTYAFLSRVTEYEKRIKNSNKDNNKIILERSIYADRHCFAKICVNLGHISKFEWQLYQEWFQMIEQKFSTKPKGIIYLQTSPEVCHERVNKRKRYEESKVSIDYIKLLHESHEEWLSSINDIPVLKISADKDFENNIENQQNIIDNIYKFINT